MILSILEFEGDPDDLASRMREHLTPVSRRVAPEFGAISSTVVRTPTGVMIVNLWRDEQGRHAMPEHPEMVAAREAAGFPPPHARAYEVLAHEQVEMPAAV